MFDVSILGIIVLDPTTHSSHFDATVTVRSRVRLNKSWFMIHKVLSFHNWILCYHGPFSQKCKKSKENTNGLCIFEILIIWSLSHKYILMIITYEHVQYWLMLISFLCLILILPMFFNWVISNLKNLILKFSKSITKTLSTWLTYFYLLTNYLNYVGSDEVLTLLDLP